MRLDRSLDLAYAVFGHDAFKKWLGDHHERVINRAIFDCISRFFSDQSVVEAAANRETEIVGAFNTLCLEQGFRDSIERTTKSLQATFYRIDRWGESLAACLGRNYDKQTRRIT